MLLFGLCLKLSMAGAGLIKLCYYDFYIFTDVMVGPLLYIVVREVTLFELHWW